MKWIITQSDIKGEINIPPSKSHTIRALLFATISNGKSIIRNPLLKGDGYSALNAAKSFGAKITENNSFLEIDGIGRDLNQGSDKIYMGNSGTGTRLFSAIAALGGKERIFDGDSSLRKRPMKILLDSLKDLGAEYKIISSSGDIPFSVKGIAKGGKTKVNGISSQFVSALLISSPLMENDTTVEVYNIHEKPYIELTLWWLDKMNIKYDYVNDFSRFDIKGKQHINPFDITIPADFSSATFSAVLAAIQGNKVTINNLDFSDPQGDKQIFTLLKKFGADVEIKDNSVAVVSRTKPLKGCEVDLCEMPDALPAVSVLACFAKGTTTIKNVKQARIKETDRISVMTKELSKMGADIKELDDGMIIKNSPLKGTEVEGYGDHRVVMSLAIAGMCVPGTTVINGAEAAEVTYPTFKNDFEKLGANIKETE